MGRREPWIDVARGAALCLVVALHATALTATHGIKVNEVVKNTNLVLDGFRMPTILMISAILAAGIGAWTWSAVLRRRVLPLLLLYGIWTVVDVTIRGALGEGGLGVDDLARIAWMGVRPDQSTWYLYALAIYIVVARATRRVPASVLVAIAIAVNVMVMSWYPYHPTFSNVEWWFYVGQHWVYFVAAQRFARRYRDVARGATPARAVAAIAVFVAAGIVAVRLSIVTQPLVVLALAAAGTAVALLAAPVWADRRWLGWARAVGSHSLGVYVIHSWMAAIIAIAIVPRVDWFRGASIVVPATVAVLAIAGSYWLTRAIERFAPVPLLRPWWSTSAAGEPARSTTVPTPAQ